MPIATPDGMKVCSKCRENKPVGEFNKSKRAPDGLIHQCRMCRRISVKQYKESNLVKIRESRANYRARYKEKYPDRVKARKLADRVRNKELHGDKETKRIAAIKKRNIDMCTDIYVIAQLCFKNSELRANKAHISKEMIELKREQILTHRAVKELNNLIKEQQK